MHQYRLGVDLLESSCAERDLRMLVDDKPAVCPCCQEGVLGCIKKSVASR